MSLLNLEIVGFGLILLSIGIYFATRKLVMKSMFEGASRAKSTAVEPLYETPMPKARVLKAREDVAVTEKNPLLDFINDWGESKLKAKAEPTAPAKKAPKAERPAPKTEKAAPKEVDNPLLKFIEEWEEPKAAPKKKK